MRKPPMTTAMTWADAAIPDAIDGAKSNPACSKSEFKFVRTPLTPENCWKNIAPIPMSIFLTYFF